MRLFWFMLIVVLLAALVLPFFLKGPGGVPLMTVQQVVNDSLPAAPVETYRWQDVHGTWQFGDAPPEDVAAERFSVGAERLTPMGSDWNVSSLVAPAGDAAASDLAVTVPDSPFSAYRGAPELLRKARQVRSELDERQADAETALRALTDSQN